MRRSEVIFLEVEDVVRAHAILIAKFGGAGGLRDAGLLESAVMAPRSGYFETLSAIAAAYAYGIAKNHAFVDGNKRAAITAAGMFLNAHGFDAVLSAEWVVYVTSLAAGELSREKLRKLLVRDAMDGVDVDIED
jgi:death-on-curing protein